MKCKHTKRLLTAVRRHLSEMHNNCTPLIIKENLENFLIHRCNYILLSEVYCVRQFVKTPTIISNNPVPFILHTEATHTKRNFKTLIKKVFNVTRANLITTFLTSEFSFVIHTLHKYYNPTFSGNYVRVRIASE